MVPSLKHIVYKFHVPALLSSAGSPCARTSPKCPMTANPPQGVHPTHIRAEALWSCPVIRFHYYKAIVGHWPSPWRNSGLSAMDRYSRTTVISSYKQGCGTAPARVVTFGWY